MAFAAKVTLPPSSSIALVLRMFVLNHSSLAVETMVHQGAHILATMVEPMSEYASRLQQAMRHAGMDPDSAASATWLANTLDISYQAARKAIAGATRMLRADNHSKAAHALGVDPAWLATGKGPQHWTSEQHPSGGVDLILLAQDLSHPTADDEPIQMQWESVVAAVNLPPRFRLAMPDDALAPATPRGTVLIFSTTATPAFGHGVLVQAADGQRHVRRYAQGPGGRWLAEARNSAYLTLDSAAGVTVLAVVVGRETGEV